MARGGGTKYRIVAHLRGGEVTESSLVAVETRPGEPGAGLAVMKRLKLGADAEPQLLERFAEEGRLCQRFDHPNLAKLVASGQEEDGPVLVFEYLEGVTLARLRSRAVRKGTGIPLPLSLLVVKQIAEGLAYAHELKDEAGKPLRIVHRDVSPENVTITYDGAVKLTDFGAAGAAAATAKSRENRVKGNVAYMAPEQARADFSLDPRADIFALGIIFWELLAGRRLWEGLSEVDVLAKLADDAPLQSVMEVAPAVPDAIDDVCMHTLAKVRDERFDSAAELAEAIGELLARPEYKATPGDLAKFTTELFADEREKMHSVIEESRAAAADTAASLPAIGTPRAPDASPLVDIESDPRLRFGVVPPEEAPVKRVVEVIQVAPASDSRFVYLMGAAVVLVLGIVTIIAVTSPKEDKKPEPKAYVPPVRPTSTTATTASAFVEPQEVLVEIRVSPADAKLFVDGVRTPNPYKTRVVPAAFQHQIRVEAEGFETRTSSVVFDRERSIEIALTPAPKPPVGVAPKPKPKPEPAPAPSAPPAPPPEAP